MNKNKFGKKKASYIIEDAPLIGEYEYYYTNKDVLVKVDQYGINMIQYKPPMDVALIKREAVKKSPWKVYFEKEGKVFDNFDFIHATSHKIEYNPSYANYTLEFGKLIVNTMFFVSKDECRVIMKTEFINNDNKDISLIVLPEIIPYMNDLLMAPWDKPEWYTKTSIFKKDKYTLFTTDRFSVSGDIKQRRYASCLFDKGEDSYSISSEMIFKDTLDYSKLNKLSEFSEEKNGLYAFTQAYASRYSFILKKGEKKTFTQILSLTDKKEERENQIKESKLYFKEEKINDEVEALDKFYDEMFEKNLIYTKDKNFNFFVNAFLPLELYWVSKLDRGWPTGMRGTRDSSNDFIGVLSYDKDECRRVLLNLFNSQRSDGWFPRQIPISKEGKFDLRPFMDGGCFVLEFLFHYLCYTHDFNILNKNAFYYDDSRKSDSILIHIFKTIDFYLNKKNIGEHGLTKINGGDWLDTLSGAGLKGRGESVMVTSQLIMSLEYVSKILEYLDKDLYKDRIKLYQVRKKEFKDSINRSSLNKKGFYNGVFTDNGEWIFSDKDPDGESRVYIPTNAYAIISGVSKNPEKVIKNIKTLKCKSGYRLFYPPMGKKKIDLVGKMGTGDLQEGFSENGNPYNHGSHGFLLRALSKIKDNKLYYDVLNFMLPYNPKYHDPKSTLSAPYAIVNVYHSVPMFNGRAGFSFLTGSVAMIHRAIFHWMAGITFTLEGIEISPCVPKEYSNMKVKYTLSNGKQLKINFTGYGTKCTKTSFGRIKNGKVILLNEELKNDLKINIILK